LLAKFSRASSLLQWGRGLMDYLGLNYLKKSEFAQMPHKGTPIRYGQKQPVRNRQQGAKKILVQLDEWSAAIPILQANFKIS